MSQGQAKATDALLVYCGPSGPDHSAGVVSTKEGNDDAHLFEPQVVEQAFQFQASLSFME